jgi:hypothetical protein
LETVIFVCPSSYPSGFIPKRVPSINGSDQVDGPSGKSGEVFVGVVDRSVSGVDVSVGSCVKVSVGEDSAVLVIETTGISVGDTCDGGVEDKKADTWVERSLGVEGPETGRLHPTRPLNIKIDKIRYKYFCIFAPLNQCLRFIIVYSLSFEPLCIITS